MKEVVTTMEHLTVLKSIVFLGSSKTAIVKETIKATPTTDPTNEIITFAPLETELGNDEGYEVEVVSLSSSHIPERRYDIANLGDPDFFQGWADVQGTGAANDYCRYATRKWRYNLRSGCK